MTVAVPDWIDFDVPERVVFTDPPLVLALCQIRFSTMLNVTQAAAVSAFQQAIIDDYPVMAQAHEQSISFQVAGNLAFEQASVQAKSGTVTWQFKDIENTWTVVLTPDFLTLETRAYNDFSDFLNRLEKLVGALAKTIRPLVGLRIGLRYVDEIRPGHSEWKRVIRPELLGALAVPRLATIADQSFQFMHFRAPDGIGVNVMHGAMPAGTVINPRPGEEAPETVFYLLDTDVYQEFKPGELAIKPRVIREHVERFHEVVSRFFRWAVTEEYMSTLPRVSNGSA
jgi:uncharacterized protein (TIGR04255 family)